MPDQTVLGYRSLGLTATAFAILAAIIVLVRIRTYPEPLEEDLLTYSVIGHELLHGKHLYTDVWDAKPPALYATYALAEGIAGYGSPEVFLLGVVAALATLVGVYRAGAALGRRAGLWAGLFWAFLSSVLAIQANQPNSEVFVNACCIGAFALLVRHPEGRPAYGRVLVAGALFALASMYKPVAVFAAALIAAAHVLAPPAGVSRKSALQETALLGAVGVAGWSLMFLYAAMTGQSAIYWATQVSANAGRSAGFLFNLYRYLREGKILPRFLWFLAPHFLALIAVSLWSLKRGHRRPWILFLGLVVATHVMIFIQGSAFHPHSYQFWLPVLAIGSGWAVAETTTEDPGTGRSRRFWAAQGVAGLALLIILLHELPNYRLPAEEWARKKYGDQILEDRDFAKSLGEQLRPEETMFQYGDMVSLYHYSSKRPPAPGLWCGFLLGRNSLGTLLSAETLARLKAAPPDLFVIPHPDKWEDPSAPASQVGLAARLLGAGKPSDEMAWDQHPVYQWALQNYTPLQPPASSARSPHFLTYVRSGSKLEDRWRGSSGK
jgi:hypothetical protein